AGAGRKPELAQMKKCLGNLDGVGEYYLTNDGEIAVLGAHCGRPGMVLIAGT
ncbi:MAG TPA: N-acetylglucosamine kinase, partial [Firmicutes bacterium]|nr:N-acetylglucosamine kinase [Bacillota bacterium]